MTVKDYLQIHTRESIDSVGIYQNGVPEQVPGSSYVPSDILDAHVTPVTVAPFMDREIDHVHTWIYDDTIENIFGETVPVQRIRACIYVK